MLVTPPESNKKVSQDLQGIFGTSHNEKNGVENAKMKKKRSSDDSHPLFMADNTKKDENSQAEVHENDKKLAHTEQKKQKRNASDPEEEEEADNENGMRAFISKR